MTEQQTERYKRHIVLPEIGIEGQEKLLKAKVLVIGAGGLGSPILQYLVASGIGKIGILDDDKISLSNLQRQVLYREHQIGQSKVNKAQETLTQLNSDVNIEVYETRLDKSNATEIIRNYDLVIAATDNFESRIQIDKATKELSIPFINGSIGEFEGQVSVFNYQGGPSYSDLFPNSPDESALPLGVIGVLPGIIGSIQACEAIKIILGIGENLSGKLLIFNALKLEFQVLNIGGD